MASHKEKEGMPASLSRHPRVLLTEDDELIARAYAASLIRAGFEVLFAKGGDEALKVITEEHPDLVLLDLVMAGKDGFEVLRAMQADEQIKSVPVVILSNLSEENNVAKGRSLGAIDYLVKSNFTIQDVIARVQGHIQKKASPRTGVRRHYADTNRREGDGIRHQIRDDTIKNISITDMAEPEKQEIKKETADGNAAGKKILLTEDDEFIARAYRDGLMRAGFDVDIARGGEEAIEMMRVNKPDLMLLDIIMAGKNGFEVLEEMRVDSELRKIPVVVLSNLGQESDIKKGRNLGAVDYLVKSDSSMKQVIERVKENLKKLSKKKT